MKKIASFPLLAIAEPTAQHQLSTIQRNALCRFFGRKDFTPEEVAGLNYAQVERLSRIGRKGLDAIRAWLKTYGYDLGNPPAVDKSIIRNRLEHRLDKAAHLLTRHGYRIEPPLS